MEQNLKVSKITFGTKDGSTNKYITRVNDKMADEINRVKKYTNVEVRISKDCDQLEIIGPFVSSPRTVYFLGLQLDVDLGFLLSSRKQNEDGFILFPLYDYLSEEIEGFDKDAFLIKLEDLKMNKIGEKKPGTFQEIMSDLLTDVGGKIKQDDSSSICRKALKTLDVSSKGGESVNSSGDIDVKTLAMDLFLQMQMCLDIRSILERIIPEGVANMFILQKNTGKIGDDYTRDDLKDLYVLDDEDGIYGNIYSAIYTVRHRNNFADYYFESDVYDKFYNGDKEYLDNFLRFAVDQMTEADWIYDITYNKIKTRSHKEYKKGKALKLYDNLDELMNVSKGDEEMEAYNTLKEPYDVAKKQIKKTSLKDILKGSYLTNILKNVASIFTKGDDLDNFADTQTKGNKAIGEATIERHIKANKYLIQIIKKALSV